MIDNKHLINSVLVGTIFASLFILFLTIGGELYGPLKSLLKEAHHHHWVGKGIWAAILFFITSAIAYTICKTKKYENTHTLPTVTAYVLAFVSIVLIAFFVYEFNIHH